jgi:predicted dehydrogenase
VTLSISADSFCGPGHRLEVYGDAGTLVLENPTSDYANGFRLSLATRAGGRLEEVPTPQMGGADGRVAAVGALMSRFVDRIVDEEDVGGSELPTLVDGVRSQELADRLRRASALGTWQK